MQELAMRELVSPQQSEQLVLLGSIVVALLGAAAGWWSVGPRGLAAALLGPLVWLLWRGHVYVTRYDPQTGYFGLDKVSVWVIEVFFFVVLGVALGVVWGRMAAAKSPTIEEK